MAFTLSTISNRATAIFAAAGLTIAAGAAEATVILSATVSGQPTNTLTSNDPNYNLNSIVLQGGTPSSGNGSVGFAAGTGVIKGEGAVNSASFGTANITGSASAQVSDVIFRHADGASCQPLCQPLLPVSIAAQFSGGFSTVGGLAPGRAGAIAQLRISQGGQTVGFDNSFADSAVDGLGAFVDTLGASFTVETGVPYTLLMVLEMRWLAGPNGFTGANSGIRADFGKTFELDPAEVFKLPPEFDILVSSESAGIFNNQILHLLPTEDIATRVSEPGALALFGIGLLGVSYMRRRGRPANC